MPILNRVLGSTAGTDAEFVEIFGTPGTSLGGISLIVVESDAGSSNGTIDFRLDFDSTVVFGSNGAFLVGTASVADAATYGVAPDLEIPTNSTENSSHTIALVETSSIFGSSVTGSEVVLDAVAITDGDVDDTFFFGARSVGPDGSFLPAGFVRDGSGFTLLNFVIDPAEAPQNWSIAPPPPPSGTELRIFEIQGDGLVSDYVGELVETTGVVTAIDSGSGYYLQDAEGDGDDTTSDGIFVFDRSATVEIGDVVRIVGTVSEFTPGGTSTRNQSTTQISGVELTETLETGTDLPNAVLIGGHDGRILPVTSIEEGIAFFESLESMVVTAQDLIAVSGTTRFGEIYTLAPDENGDYRGLSERGTLNISEGDFNPEKVQIDEDSGVFDFDFPTLDTGAHIGDVTGVVGFSFGNYEIIPTVDFTGQIIDSTLEAKATTLSGSASGLTVATYNVLNLDPLVEDRDLTAQGRSSDVDDDIGDGRFDAIASQIVANLGSPDILGLQEIQDNNGAQIFDASGNIDGVNSADVTLQTLIDAIVAAGGPTYEFIETPNMPQTFFDETGDLIRPVGGQPGGDIRNAFLYNPERVSLVEGSVRTLTDGDGDVFPFFEGRLPLIADFDFGGEIITIVNVHLSSKSGSAPLFGTEQPFDTDAAQEDPNINGDVDQRLEQATFIKTYIETYLADANVMVIGDFNEFEFVSPVEIFANAGFTNLTNQLPEDERYSFVFDGNSQSLDHILVSERLAGTALVDNVHVNAEFAATSSRASDHDAIVSVIDFAPRTVADYAQILLKGNEFFEVDLLGNDSAPGTRDIFISEISGQNVDKRPIYFIEEGGKKIGIVKLEKDGTILVKATRPVDQLEFTYKISNGVFESEEATARFEIRDIDDTFTLNLLHIADQEAGAAAVEDAPHLSAVLNALRDEDVDADAVLTLSSGDAFIPGLFYDASVEVYGSGGIADILIQNELGLQAIALGNHEFDFGTAELAGLISGSADANFDFTGAAFPYLSTNLDFSTDSNLAPLAVAGGQAPQGNVVTSSTVIEQNGERFGVIGATTPTLASISSPGDVGIAPLWAGSNPTDAELDALAAEIQLEVDALLADNTSMNKVILLAHMQQIEIEYGLAARLTDVDIIVAGGSNTRLVDETDRLRDGDSAQGDYPQFIENAGGTITAVVNTDGSYKYVGRLVIDFDAFGNVIAESYDAEISGAYATDAEGVAALGAEGLIDPEIQAISDAILDQIILTEGNVFGVSNVFLNGNRSGTDAAGDPDGIRTQETNLGNLTADANLAYANDAFVDFDGDGVDDEIWFSLKNGGGIRASIGETVVPPGGTEPIRTVNEAIFDADGTLVKPEGGISQNDIQTTLAFNNDLVVGELAGAEIVALLEHGVSAVPGVSGQFLQIAGIEFSYDPAEAVGNRIESAAFVNADGSIRKVLVDEGTVLDPTAEYGIVTLGFLAAPRFDDGGNFIGGGDGYPFPEDFIFTSLETGLARTGGATFADDGTEQDALAEYLLANFATVDTAYDEADVGRDEDGRIISLAYQDGAELDSAINLFLEDQFILELA
jgi:predicted extracellular nuclease/2',3'-cyclic-nucleotide 2'-phosphodiesterase (5'-nucleotidase family)